MQRRKLSVNDESQQYATTKANSMQQRKLSTYKYPTICNNESCLPASTKQYATATPTSTKQDSLPLKLQGITDHHNPHSCSSCLGGEEGRSPAQPSLGGGGLLPDQSFLGDPSTGLTSFPGGGGSFLPVPVHYWIGIPLWIDGQKNENVTFLCTTYVVDNNMLQPQLSAWYWYPNQEHRTNDSHL